MAIQIMRPAQRTKDGFGVKTKKKDGHEGRDEGRTRWSLLDPLNTKKVGWERGAVER